MILKNRILVTGLALGNDPDVNTCQSCNYDLSWLFSNPSTLLWADKIVLTQEILENIKRSSYPHANKELGKAINLIFEGLEDNGLIEVKKVSNVITKEIKDSIYAQIEEDRRLLNRVFPESVQTGKQKIPGQIFVNNLEYCSPSLWTMYASFILAKEWETELLFPKYAQNYFEKISLAVGGSQNAFSEKHVVFNEIIRSKLPEQELLPIILFDAKQCDSCGHHQLCSTDVFAKVESNINDILNWRSYDEIQELKLLINSVVKEADNKNVSTSELIAAFKDKEKQINKSIRSVFPKVERWSNMATALSLPVAIAGVSTGSVSLATIGAGVAGIATATSKYIEILRSKYRWVGHKISS